MEMEMDLCLGDFVRQGGDGVCQRWSSAIAVCKRWGVVEGLQEMSWMGKKKKWCTLRKCES